MTYRAWDIVKVSDELFIAKYAFDSILELYARKTITDNSLEKVKNKIDKHIKRWGW